MYFLLKIVPFVGGGIRSFSGVYVESKSWWVQFSGWVGFRRSQWVGSSNGREPNGFGWWSHPKFFRERFPTCGTWPFFRDLKGRDLKNQTKECTSFGIFIFSISNTDRSPDSVHQPSSSFFGVETLGPPFVVTNHKTGKVCFVAGAWNV